MMSNYPGREPATLVIAYGTGLIGAIVASSLAVPASESVTLGIAVALGVVAAGFFTRRMSVAEIVRAIRANPPIVGSLVAGGIAYAVYVGGVIPWQVVLVLLIPVLTLLAEHTVLPALRDAFAGDESEREKRVR